MALIHGSPIVPPPPDLVIFTDASKMGGDAVCNKIRTNGKWSGEESSQHINMMELKAGFLAIQSLLKDQHHVMVSLNMDNSTAVSYANHEGGTRSPELK